MKLWVIIAFCTVNFASYSQENDNLSVPVLKNAVFAEPLGMSLMSVSLNYERIIPVSGLFNLSVRGGLSWFYVPSVIVCSNVVIGGSHHFGEFGIGANTFWAYEFYEDSDAVFYFNKIMPIFNFGYRYQGEKGLLLKGTGYIFNDGEDNRIWPGASVGYCF